MAARPAFLLALRPQLGAEENAETSVPRFPAHDSLEQRLSKLPRLDEVPLVGVGGSGNMD